MLLLLLLLVPIVEPRAGYGIMDLLKVFYWPQMRATTRLTQSGSVQREKLLSRRTRARCITYTLCEGRLPRLCPLSHKAEHIQTPIHWLLEHALKRTTSTLPCTVNPLENWSCWHCEWTNVSIIIVWPNRNKIQNLLWSAWKPTNQQINKNKIRHHCSRGRRNTMTCLSVPYTQNTLVTVPSIYKYKLLHLDCIHIRVLFNNSINIWSLVLIFCTYLHKYLTYTSSL